MSISNQLHKIKKTIGPDVELVAVGKRQPDDLVRQALEAGQRIFGENQLQEAMSKWPDFRAKYSDITLHMIGPLQSNKAKDAVSLFNCIQTLDRKKIIDACSRHQSDLGHELEYYIQVNTGAEDQKSGVLPQQLDDLYIYATENAGLNVVGLMCIPPVDEAPGLHFALLNKLARRLKLNKLSMGMSNDYKTAVQFGATSVRVGSALFGPRDQS